MTTVNEISNWIQNVLKTSGSYSNEFYYDGHGMIKDYERAIKEQKEVIKIIKSKEKILKQIHEKRLETSSLFSPFVKDINRLEIENHRLELQMAENEVSRSNEILIIFKNLVALSKITDTLMHELPKSSRIEKTIKNIQRFQITAEPTVDIMKQILDKKFKESDEEDKKDR